MFTVLSRQDADAGEVVAGPEKLLEVVGSSRLTPRYFVMFILLMLFLIGETFDFFVVGFLVSDIGLRWHLSYGKVTIILLSAGLGAMFGGIAIGRVSDRFGRKRAIVGGGYLYCICAGMAAFLPNGAWILFAGLRFLVGVGYGGAGCSQYAMVAEQTPARYRALMGSLLGAFATGGVLVGSMLVSSIYPRFGWRGVAILGFFPIVITILVHLLVHESIPWSLANGRLLAAASATKAIFGVNVRVVPGAVKVEISKSEFRWKDLLIDRRRLWLILTVMITAGAAYTGMVLWGPTLITQTLHVSLSSAARIFALLTFVGIVGRLFFAYFSNHFGRLPAGYLLSFGGCALLLCAAILRNQTLGTIPAFVICFGVAQFFVDGGFTNINPYGAELYKAHPAMGMGVAQVGGGIGKILGPVLLGLLAGAGNLVSTQVTQRSVLPGMLSLAIAMFVCGLSYVFWGIETCKISAVKTQELY